MVNKRSAIIRSVEFTADDNSDDSDGRNLSGYAAIFNEPTDISNPYEGTFRETIAPGAFKKTLEGGRLPKLLWNHGKDSRMGSVPIGAYDSMNEDSHGLKVQARLFDNPTVESVRQAIAAGAVDGMSITMNVLRDVWTDAKGKPVTGRELQRMLQDPGENGPLQRQIKEIKLLEAGPVLYPAYPGTSVGVRSAEENTPVDRLELVKEYCRSSNTPITDLEKDADTDFPVGDSETDDSVMSDQADSDDDTMHVMDNGICITCGPDAMSGRAADPKKPYGPVAYADPGYQKDGKKRYPVDTAAHVKAALSYIGQAHNASMYSDEQLTKIKSKIDTAAKKFGIGVAADETKSDQSDVATRTSVNGRAALRDTLPTQKADTSARTPKKRNKIMTLAELREHLATISVRLEDLHTEYRDADMPDAEDVEFEKLKAERASIETKIEKIEARLHEFRDQATSTKHTERGSDTPAYIKRTDDTVFDMDALRRDAYNEEDYRDRLTDNAKHAIDVLKFGGGRKVRREDAQGQIEYFLDDKDDKYGTLAKRILVSGSPAYERAWSKAVTSGNPSLLMGEEARALSLGSDGAGGFAVPVQLDPTVILTSPGTIDPLRSIARVEQIVGKQWQGVTSAGVSVSRSAEAAEAADNSFSLTQKTVNTVRVDGFVPFSYEIDMAWGQIRTEITTTLADAKAQEEASSFLFNNGTPPAANGLLGTIAGGNTTTTAGVATLAAADVYGLEVALDARWRNNGKFLAHRGIYNLIRQFDLAGGAELWERIGAGLPSALLGYDALESSAMVSTTTTGNKVAIFGDFQQFLIVDRIGMDVEIIPQLFGPNQRPTGQRGIYAIWMNNCKVLVDAAFRILVTQ